MRGHQEHLERGYSDAPGCVACGGELDPEGTSEHCARCDAESADAADARDDFERADTVPPPAPVGPEGDLFAASLATSAPLTRVLLAAANEEYFADHAELNELADRSTLSEEDGEAFAAMTHVAPSDAQLEAVAS